MGITIYEIATGNPPFADQDPMRAVSMIPKSKPAQLGGDWSPAMKEFVALCLHDEPNEVSLSMPLIHANGVEARTKGRNCGLTTDLCLSFFNPPSSLSGHRQRIC